MRTYDPKDWFWIVGGDESSPFSSKTGDFVPANDSGYQAFVSDGNRATRIASEAELGEVLADARVRPTSANVLDGFKSRHAEALTLEIIAKLLLWLINEVRGLKGQETITAKQFKAFIKDKM